MKLHPYQTLAKIGGAFHMVIFVNLSLMLPDNLPHFRTMPLMRLNPFLFHF